MMCSKGDKKSEKIAVVPEISNIENVESAYVFRMAGSPIVNSKDLFQKLNLAEYHKKGVDQQSTTIAILDNGFGELEYAMGRTIPPGLRVMGLDPEACSADTHGTKMAEVVYTFSTGELLFNRDKKGPQLKLFCTKGPYARLEHAVDQLVGYKRDNPEQVVYILYSQIWEYGGNGDGRGYINRIVNRAINAGIIWVNAVGNLGKSSYTTTANVDSKGTLNLPFMNRYIRFNVPANFTEVKIVLAWGDFSNSYYHYKTSIDFDLILENSKGEELARANLIQDGKDHEGQKGYSRHAREMIKARLRSGDYLLRVVANSANIDSNLKVWVTINGNGVVMEDSNGDNVVFMPADNPEVLSIGAFDVDYGNLLQGNVGSFKKPEVVTPSTILFENGMLIHGSSAAAAIAVSAFNLFGSVYGHVTRVNLHELIVRGKLSLNSSEIPLLYLPPISKIAE